LDLICKLVLCPGEGGSDGWISPIPWTTALTSSGGRSKQISAKQYVFIHQYICTPSPTPPISLSDSYGGAATSKGTDARGGSWPDLLREGDDDARRSGRRREEYATAAAEDPRSAASSAPSQDPRIKSLDSGSACK